MATRAARDPSPAMQIDHHRERRRPLRHRDIRRQPRPQLDRLMEGADFRRHRVERLAVAVDKLAQRRNVLRRLLHTFLHALQDIRFVRHLFALLFHDAFAAFFCGGRKPALFFTVVLTLFGSAASDGMFHVKHRRARLLHHPGN